MSLELMLLVAQTASVFFLAAWLTTGVFENIFYPKLNSVFTSEVLEMTRLRDDYPEAYAMMAHRRIVNPATQKWLFRLIVLWELAATIALWIGYTVLTMAMFDLADPNIARALGLLGTILFTATWAGFLIAGNWFCYWFGHEGAQNTHFQMVLWGMATLVLLAVA